MPKIAPTSVLAALALALVATLSGCASVNKELRAENGPTLSVNGRISVRKLGKPLQAGTYTWNRGPGLNGWTESIDFSDARGLTFLAIDSDDTGTKAKFLDRTVVVDSVRYLMRTEMGIDIEPGTLASWMENDYGGEPVPEEFEFEDVRVRVVVRDSRSRPYQLLLRQGDTLVVMTVRREFNE